MLNYSKEQLWKIYKKIPKDLQEAIFSEKTADKIRLICEKNKIEKSSKIAEYVGYSLIGVLHPKKLQKIFISDLLIEEDIAKRIYLEISKSIFIPVKDSLKNIYNNNGESRVKKFLEKNEDIYKEPI